MIKALEEGSFTGWSTTPGHLPARRRAVVAQLVATPDDLALCCQGIETPATATVAYVLERIARGAPVDAACESAASTACSDAHAVLRLCGRWQARARIALVIFSAELLIQTLLSGLMVGVLYALMALGITFIYSIMKTINWAMGEFYMIGSYLQFVAGALPARARTCGGWRSLISAAGTFLLGWIL